MSVILEGKKGVYEFDPQNQSTKLGEGGMGLVYLGNDVQNKRKVAIKVLFKELSANPVNIERALKEANIKLNHKNVIKMIEFVEKDRIYHIVSEYLEGKSLDKYIDQNKVISRNQAIEIACEVLKGLEALHNSVPPIVHRDIKPSNIFMCHNGDIKIMDFGVARSIESSGKRLTKTGSVVGTPYYAAPEQIRSQSNLINPTTDIYSLGVTLYEMLTGEVPFEGDSEYDTLKMQVEKPLPPHPKIPSALFKVISKATAKAQAQRYRTSRDFINALGPFRVKKKPAVAVKEKPSRKGAVVLNWIAVPLLLLVTVAFFLTLNELQEERYSTSSYQNNLSFENYDLSEQVNTLKGDLYDAVDHYPIIVERAPVRFLDSQDRSVIYNFQDELYSLSNVILEPKVVYRSLVPEAKTLKFHYRLFNPSGKLLYNTQYVADNPIDPRDNFTNFTNRTIYSDEQGEFLMGGFRDYFPAGSYRIEIWHRDKCLFYRYFRVN